MNSRLRPFAPILLGAALLVASVSTTAVAQQPEEPPAEAAGGRAFDGYFATGLLAGLALFIVARTARR